jgi:hypothetical protein
MTHSYVSLTDAKETLYKAKSPRTMGLIRAGVGGRFMVSYLLPVLPALPSALQMPKKYSMKSFLSRPCWRL